jgi:hypothetical protein
VPHDRNAPCAADVEPRDGREAAAEKEPDRRCDDEAGVLAVEHDAWRRERVQCEKPSRREERESDKEHPGIAAPARDLAHG